MEDFVFNLHSGVRWLVVLMTVIAFGWLLFGMLTNRAYDKMTHGIVAGWAGLVGLQWIIGLVLFVILGDFDIRWRWEHLAVMTIALAIAHAYVRLKSSPDMIRYRGALLSIAVVAVLVYAGVALLPQGWAV